jgi:hypothetical protein
MKSKIVLMHPQGPLMDVSDPELDGRVISVLPQVAGLAQTHRSQLTKDVQQSKIWQRGLVRV